MSYKFRQQDVDDFDAIDRACESAQSVHPIEWRATVRFPLTCGRCGRTGHADKPLREVVHQNWIPPTTCHRCQQKMAEMMECAL